MKNISQRVMYHKIVGWQNAFPELYLGWLGSIFGDDDRDEIAGV